MLRDRLIDWLFNLWSDQDWMETPKSRGSLRKFGKWGDIIGMSRWETMNVSLFESPQWYDFSPAIERHAVSIWLSFALLDWFGRRLILQGNEGYWFFKYLKWSITGFNLGVKAEIWREIGTWRGGGGREMGWRGVQEGRGWEVSELELHSWNVNIRDLAGYETVVRKWGTWKPWGQMVSTDENACISYFVMLTALKFH